MRRRKFLLGSASTILSGSSITQLTNPVIGLEFNISKPENQKPSETDSILIQFDKLQLTPQYINDNEPATLQAKLEADGRTETSNKINTLVTNGQTKELKNNINPIQLDNITEDEFIRGTVTVSINHPSIKDSYSQTFTISNPSIPDSVLTQDLVAWYRFEDGDARDYTATLNAEFADTTAYNGTVNDQTYKENSGVTDYNQGSNSGCFEFNGGTDSNGKAIELPDIITGNNNLSILGWINMNNTNNDNAYLISLRQSQYFEIGALNSEWAFKFGSNDQVINKTIDQSSNEWIHIAQTANDTTGTAYINGSEVDTISTDSVVNGNTNLIGGRGEGNSEQYVDGLIDDVRVYNRELTGTEITDIYNNTKPQN